MRKRERQGTAADRVPKQTSIPQRLVAHTIVPDVVALADSLLAFFTS